MKPINWKIAIATALFLAVHFGQAQTPVRNNPYAIGYQPTHLTRREARREARVLRQQGNLELAEGRTLRHEGRHTPGRQGRLLRREGRTDRRQGRVLKEQAKIMRKSKYP